MWQVVILGQDGYTALVGYYATLSAARAARLHALEVIDMQNPPYALPDVVMIFAQ